MPKATLPQGAGKKPLKITRKFKMGGRKSNLSGLSLSTDGLIAKLESANGRTKQKIQAIFDMRGFNLAAHLQAQADAVAAAEAAELQEIADMEAAEAADNAVLDATDASA
jgi:hypothetical protein